MRFSFDGRGIEPSGQGVEIWPAGWYPVAIRGEEMKPTRDGQGQRLSFKIECLDGPAKGKINYIGLNLQNKSEKAVEIAYRTLSAIAWVCGKPAFQDTMEIHNIPFAAYAKPSDQSNDWQGFMDMQGRTANDMFKAQGGQQQPQTFQPPGAGVAPPPGAGGPPAAAWGQPAQSAAEQPPAQQAWTPPGAGAGAAPGANSGGWPQQGAAVSPPPPPANAAWTPPGQAAQQGAPPWNR